MSATFQDSKVTTGPLTEEEPKRNNDFVSKSEEMISTIKRENDSTDDFVKVDQENLFVVVEGGGGEGGEIGKKKEEKEEEGGGSFGKEPKKGGGEVKAEVEVEVSKEEEEEEEEEKKKKKEEKVLAKEEMEEEKKGEKREGEGSTAVEEKLESLPATTTVSSSTTEPPRVQDNHNHHQQHHHHRPGDSTDLKVNTDHQLAGINERSSFLNEDQVGEEEKALPATPPPSADIEKYNTMADPFQRPVAGRTTSAEEEGFNPRAAAAATVAFVETERAAAAAAAVAAAASSASSPSVQNLSTNGADNTVLLDFSDNTNGSLTSLTTSDQTKMNIDQSLNPITKDTNEKVDDASSNLLDLDSFQSSTTMKTTTTTTTTITPPVSLAKVNTDNTDLLSTGNHETFERVDDNAVTKNDDKKILDDRFNVEDISSSSSSPVVVDVLPAIAKKDLNDVNVNDVVVAPKTIATESTTTTTTTTTIERKDKSDDNKINFDKRSDESEATTIPSKTSSNVTQDIGRKEEVERNFDKSRGEVREFQVAPNEIFRDIGIDAWFNPEILNPKVATLIYWRDPKTTGAVFGAILGLLLSLAYFSLISVLAYLSLLILIGTVAFRIYKSVLQAIQKTSDGHPFKYVLDLDLTLSTEKVHELADISVAHLNAAISELRRLFLVEDIVDSLKFGVLLWCFTYIGSWFNGMTIIIMGFVALFTLPKVYETNKTQIDEHMAMTKERIDEFYAKFKAFIPLFKKPEPTKED